MKKIFRNYVTIWLILLVIFNVIVFVTPNKVVGLSKFGGTFWIGYVFIMLAFIGQLVCTYVAFRENVPQKIFLNLPLITISYSTLITSIFLGTLCMVIPFLPNWLAIIVCVVELGVNAVAVVKAKTAAEVVSELGDRVKMNTIFIKSLTVDAESLVARAMGNEAKAAAKKVYEIVRYSDPMSNAMLSGVEAQITLKFDEFSKAVVSGNGDVTRLAEEIIVLVNDRNKKCKLLK